MDEYVASARAHWGPRFTANGVLAADFDKAFNGLESWDDWCSTWSNVAAGHERLGEEALREGRLQSAGSHFSTAAVTYHFAKFVFVRDLEQMRTAHMSAVRAHTAALALMDPPGERVEIPFEGSTLYGVFRKPAGPGPHPTVLMVPGLDSTKEELRPTEELFLERGMATFSVDGPGQGEAEYDLAIRPDYEVAGRTFIDALVARADVDANRIGVWGVSLGGYYAPRIASGDDRVRACISLCGPYTFGESWDIMPALTRETFEVRSRSESDSAARNLALQFSMRGRTEIISCPILVVGGKKDRLIPWEQAQRLADETAGRSEFLLLENGNHGCANVLAEHRYRSADWMLEQLTGASQD